MFSKYAREVPDKLSMKELWHMTQANSVAYDFFGWYNNINYIPSYKFLSYMYTQLIISHVRK
jgi:hypothetical protein